MICAAQTPATQFLSKFLGLCRCTIPAGNSFPFYRCDIASHLHILQPLKLACSQGSAQKPHLTPALSALAKTGGRGLAESAPLLRRDLKTKRQAILFGFRSLCKYYPDNSFGITSLCKVPGEGVPPLINQKRRPEPLGAPQSVGGKQHRESKESLRDWPPAPLRP